MRRVFLRVYASVILVLVLLFGAVQFYFRSAYNPERQVSLDAHGAPAMRGLAKRVHESTSDDERRAHLQEAAAVTNPAFAILPIDAIAFTPDERSALSRGEVILVSTNGIPWTYIKVPDEDRVIEYAFLGPEAFIFAPVAFAAAFAANDERALERELPMTGISDLDRARSVTRMIIGDDEHGERTMFLQKRDGSFVTGRAPPTLFFFVQFMPLVMLIAVGFVIALGIRPLQRDLERLETATTKFSGGNFDARANLDDKSPVSDLGNRFDVMATRISTVFIDNEELFRAVSHELRTPISRLMFSLDLIRDEPNAEERTRLLDGAVKSVDELGALSSELLELARLGETAPRLNVERVSVSELVSDAVNRAQSHAFQIDALVDNNVPVMDVDRRLLARALSNLIENAKRYGGNEIGVSARVVHRGVVISVDDNGPGIPVDDRERVLLPFQRGEQSRSRETGGAGLGLAIVKRVVERHHGTLTVGQSESKGGACLTMFIPIFSDQDAAART